MKKIYILTILLMSITSMALSANSSKSETGLKAKMHQQALDQLNTLRQNSTEKPVLKSVQGKVMLEKITFPNGESKVFGYNSSGKTIDYKSNELNQESGIIELKEHNTSSYDSRGNRLNQIFNSLRDGQFVVTEKNEWEYDSQNREILYIISLLDENTNKLTNYSKKVTSYESKSVKTDEYTWNTERKEWENVGKTEVLYEGNLPVTGTYYYRNEENGVIEKSMIIEMTYDNNGRLVRSKMKALNEAGALIDYMKTENTFDSNGNETLSVTSVYDEETKEWTMWSKLTSTYNSSGLLISDEYQTLDWLTFKLAISEKHEYNYSGKQLKEEVIWETGYFSSDLIQTYKYVYSYDNSIKTEDLILPDSWLEHNGYEDIQSEFVFSFGALSNAKWYQLNYETLKLEMHRDASYHYKSFSGGTGFNQFMSKELKANPNPFKNNLNLQVPPDELCLVRIFTPEGKKIFEAQMIGENRIETSSWDAGIYIVKIISKQRQEKVIKLIKN